MNEIQRRISDSRDRAAQIGGLMTREDMDYDIGKFADLLTVTEAAAEANVNVSTLRYAIQRGKLAADKFGNLWVIRRADLQRWLDDPAAHKTGRKAK